MNIFHTQYEGTNIFHTLGRSKDFYTQNFPFEGMGPEALIFWYNINQWSDIIIHRNNKLWLSCAQLSRMYS